MKSYYNDTPKIRYRLNENANGDRMAVERFTLSKKEWLVVPSLLSGLRKWVRTKENPKGILDYEKYIPNTNEVVYSSKYYYESKPMKVSRELLLSYNRKQLCEVGYVWGIMDNYPDKVLIQKIMEKQEEALRVMGEGAFEGVKLDKPKAVKKVKRVVKKKEGGDEDDD